VNERFAPQVELIVVHFYRTCAELMALHIDHVRTQLTYEWPVSPAANAQITVAAANKTNIGENATIGDEIEIDFEIFFW
jgi:hypothetical protein